MGHEAEAPAVWKGTVPQGGDVWLQSEGRQNICWPRVEGRKVSDSGEESRWTLGAGSPALVGLKNPRSQCSRRLKRSGKGTGRTWRVNSSGLVFAAP